MKRIAVIGGGVSGLVAAWRLGETHDVVLFEREGRVGGHTRTVEVTRGEDSWRVDVGFIVFNDRTYPEFNRMLDTLGLGRQPSSMGFSVSSPVTGVEYSGDGLGGLFARRANLFSPAHWRMLAEILRFNRRALALLDSAEGELPLGEYLEREGYSERFRSHYILAMGGAIWSCGEARMEDFPARFFVRFLANHGLLQLRDRPQWFVVPGGSDTYVQRMLERMKASVRTATAVSGVRRGEDGVMVGTAAGVERFDEVVFACHSNQALALLDDADELERDMLGAIEWEENEVVLHTDTSLLPRCRRAWSSWNARVDGDHDRTRLTYNMNILQGIEAPVTFCVTLNSTDRIDPESVIDRYHFSHPAFTPSGIEGRRKVEEHNGRRNSWFCGAWCRYGFHEDGVVSALRVVEALEKGS